MKFKLEIDFEQEFDVDDIFDLSDEQLEDLRKELQSILQTNNLLDLLEEA